MTSKKAEWDSKLFSYHGGYLTYNNEFIARFKGISSGMGAFKRFLMEHYTPTEYLELLAMPHNSPMSIVQARGFMTKREKEQCIKWGMEPTRQNAEWAHVLEMRKLFPADYSDATIKRYWPGCPIPA